MGRFKIYDPTNLVKVLNDANYAKCLICEKKLKNIMGNIKRHYKQMHNMYIDKNIKLEKKSRKKKALHKEYTDKNYKLKKKTIEEREKNKKESNPALECGKSNTNKNETTAEITNFIPVVLNKEQIVEEKIQAKIFPKTKSKENHINSNLKKVKLNIENDKTPATYIIHNVQLPSVETCHEHKFFKCLVETKIQLNLPLKYLEECGLYRKALELEKQTFEFNYSPQTIGQHLDSMAIKLHQEIRKIVTNRLVYLKLDATSSKEINVMLVNIQFIKDFKIQVITLSALELLNEHLATNLKENVLSVLEQYKIEISKVYSITKDYANRQCQNTNENDTESFLKHENPNETNASTATQTTEYCQNLCEQFPGHSIHFVACDIIKQLNENISQSRDSAINLRRQMLKLNMKPLPDLDNASSWFSIYNMMKSLLNVQEKVESNSKILVEVDWKFVTKFEASFRPIIDMALMLQSNQHFIMGDLYREWLLCESELQGLSESNELALYLLESLHKRKSFLFENTAFLAALYLDPRFFYMGSMHLSDKQKEMATAHLLQIFNRLKGIHECNNPKLVANTPNGRYLKLEKKVAQNMPTNHTIKMVATCALSDVDCPWVKEALERLQFEDRLPFSTNILDYWKMAQYRNPILSKIAETALAVPASQATINRALSAWPMLTLKRRFQLHKDNIENILLLTLNQDIVDQISLANQLI